MSVNDYIPIYLNLYFIIFFFFTTGSKNDWSLGVPHKGFDGCKESYIIVKYHINLQGVTVTATVKSMQNQIQNNMQFNDAKWFTSSNRISDVDIFFLSVTVDQFLNSSTGTDEISPAGFSDRTPECNWSALAFILKKLAKIIVAGLGFLLQRDCMIFCPLLFEVEITCLVDAIFLPVGK